MTSAALIIANTSEAFLPLIRKYGADSQPSRILDEHVLGDRALLWGGATKLVVTSLPVSHVKHIQAAIGYSELKNVSPENPSESLCSDILSDRELFTAICQWAARYDEIALLSYVASSGLADVVAALQAARVNLNLVETPDAPGRAAAQRFGTKCGFRTLLSQWQEEDDAIRLPPGIVCDTPREAVYHIKKRLDAGIRSLCKPDKGESGIGLLWFSPDAPYDAGDIARRIAAEPAFVGDSLVVEDVIPAPTALPPICRSPSIEVYIAPDRAVYITYVCAQLVDSHGHFSGVLIDAHSLPREITDQMRRCAESVGHRLASHGYIGYFDLDFVVGSDSKAYVVEGNPRRTGGTHAHDLATFLFGHTYNTDRAVLSRMAAVPPHRQSWTNIKRCAGNLMFSTHGPTEGVVPSVISGIPRGIVGYVILARSAAHALALESRFLDAIGAIA